MPIFYRGPSARITHLVLEVGWPTFQVYRLSDLESAWVVQRREFHPVMVMRPYCRSGIVALTALATTQSAYYGGVLSVWLWLAVVLGGLLGAVLETWSWRRGRIYELWAIYYGRPVCLFVTHDPTTFGQIRRALQRALEWRRDAT
jgi:Family of unknown function (DUF6232)